MNINELRRIQKNIGDGRHGYSNETPPWRLKAVDRWLANDEQLSMLVVQVLRGPASLQDKARAIKASVPDQTPDGVNVTVHSIVAHLSRLKKEAKEKKKK